ncbi:CHC2 zinc finger domain-containing protein [Mesorhizobium sp. ANAO-SY3R2]|uniref:DUF7146 domain-containing protein n=1 Tax=Mesorhizobium sp. ANAO-SY3R2 TaxID=3166644 RepID=UPI00366C2BF6
MSRRIDPIELEHLKDRTPLSAVFAQYGIKGKGQGKVIWANCCFHGEKTPSLKINDERGMYHCFGCGATGDHFTVLTELGGKSFPEAIQALGGQTLVTAEERKAIEERKARWEEEERKEKERGRSNAERLFGSGKQVAGTLVEEYLRARKLMVTPSWTFDLRFVAELSYRGYADSEAEETVELGKFPAMVAAIRDAGGKIIGAHRTYLDPQQPAKLTPPGDRKRNKAKKVLGEQRGGMIRLSAPGRRLATGEGIETTRSWFVMGMAEGDDIALAAAVSLGNLAGSSTGSRPHPKDERKLIPNGFPDMQRPGLVLPREVEESILIGDGDSEPCMTRARLLVAARRFHQQGRIVSISMAPDGYDFSDLLMQEMSN